MKKLLAAAVLAIFALVAGPVAAEAQTQTAPEGCAKVTKKKTVKKTPKTIKSPDKKPAKPKAIKKSKPKVDPDEGAEE